MSPCDHAKEVGALDDFVGICISGASNGAENVSAWLVCVEFKLFVKLTSTAPGFVAST
jgi:hypothetical protein